MPLQQLSILTGAAYPPSVSPHDREFGTGGRVQEAITREALALDEEGKEAASRLERIGNDRSKHARLLKAFAEAQSWSEAQLRQWTELAAERDKDSLALQAYGRQDDETIKRLNKELLRHCPAFIRTCIRSYLSQIRS